MRTDKHKLRFYICKKSRCSSVFWLLRSSRNTLEHLLFLQMLQYEKKGLYICKLLKYKRKRARANAPKSPYKCVATEIRETNITIIRNCEDILHVGLLRAHPHHNTFPQWRLLCRN